MSRTMHPNDKRMHDGRERKQTYIRKRVYDIPVRSIFIHNRGHEHICLASYVRSSKLVYHILHKILETRRTVRRSDVQMPLARGNLQDNFPTSATSLLKSFEKTYILKMQHKHPLLMHIIIHISPSHPRNNTYNPNTHNTHRTFKRPAPKAVCKRDNEREGESTNSRHDRSNNIVCRSGGTDTACLQKVKCC